MKLMNTSTVSRESLPTFGVNNEGHITHIDEVLRTPARQLSPEEMTSPETQQIIDELFRRTRGWVDEKGRQLGVGMAAPQLGENIAVAVVCINPPDEYKGTIESFEMAMINPHYKGIGERRPSSLPDGCMSSYTGDPATTMLGQTMRYGKVEVEWYDEKGNYHTKVFSGVQAQVIQHEADHLYGVVFADRLAEDPKKQRVISQLALQAMKA